MKYAVFRSSTMASRFSVSSSERMPWLPLLVSTVGDLLLRVFGTTLVTYPGAPRINVKRETEPPLHTPGKAAASDPGGLALPEALRPVALDVAAEVLDLFPRPVLGPAEVIDGHRGCSLVHVERHVRAQADHRAPEERVGQGLGHLPPEGVEHLASHENRLDGRVGGERDPQGGVVAGLLEDLWRAGAVEPEQALGELFGEAARGLEVRGEGGEVRDGPAREGDLVRAALRGFAAELLEGDVHRLAGEVAVGGELAADDGDEAVRLRARALDREPPARGRAARGVIVDDVGARDRALRALRLPRQRPDAGVGEEHILPGEVRRRDHGVCLLDEVVDLVVVRRDVVQVFLVAEVGSADEIPSVPRHYKVRPAVLAGLDVEGVRRGAGEGVNDQVRALGAPDHLLPLPGLPLRRVVDSEGPSPGEHLVHPRPGHIDGYGGVRLVHAPVQLVLELYPRYPRQVPVAGLLEEQVPDLGVGNDHSTMLAGADRVLDGDPLRVLDLTIVIGGGAEEAFEVQAGVPFQGFVAGEHLVVRDGLVEGEDIVADHAEPDQARPALAPVVDRDDEPQRFHEVRRYMQELLALGEGLAHEVDLVVLQVAQAAVDQAGCPLGGPVGDVALVQEQDLQAAHGGVAGDAGAVDAGPDHDEVEGVVAYVLGDLAGHGASLSLLGFPSSAGLRVVSHPVGLLCERALAG